MNRRAKCDAGSFILGGEKNTQTANDISTPCRSACVDNNPRFARLSYGWQTLRHQDISVLQGLGDFSSRLETFLRQCRVFTEFDLWHNCALVMKWQLKHYRRIERNAYAWNSPYRYIDGLFLGGCSLINVVTRQGLVSDYVVVVPKQCYFRFDLFFSFRFRFKDIF